MCRPLWVGHGFRSELIGAQAAGNGRVYVTTFLNTPSLSSGRLLVFPAAGRGQVSCAPSWTASIGGPAGRTGAPAVTRHTVFTTSGTLLGTASTANST